MSGKIEDVSRHEGRTVLFVSHDIATIANLTSRGIVLKSGSIIADGPVTEAISAYSAQGPSSAIYIAPATVKSSSPHLKRVEVLTSEPNSVHQFGKSLEVKFLISHAQKMSKACFSFNVVNQYQQPVVHAWAFYPEFVYGTNSGETLLICRFPSLKLNVGRYHLRTHLTEPPGMEIYEKLDGLCPFEVARTEDTTLMGLVLQTNARITKTGIGSYAKANYESALRWEPNP